MAVKIKLNYVRHSARKLRPVLSMFVGKPLESSIDQSSLMAQDSARMFSKALKMARAAASEKKFDTDRMIIAEAFASEGPRIKRSRPNARGRANRYIKHLAHLTVVLKESTQATPVHNGAKPKPKTKVATEVRSKKATKK